MQDRPPPTRRSSLATHGRTILWVTLLCASQELLRVNHFRHPTRAREAPGADSGSRFHFLVSAARRRRCRGWRRWPPLVPAAELDRGRATRWLPKAAAPPRRRTGSASTISVTLTRAREAPGADSRSRFHFLVSAARRRRCRGWRRWPPLVPAAELDRGRARRWLPKAARASVGGLRRVLALDFQAGFPAGAIGVFIHWRGQPTGAGDLAFMDRRWPSAAEAAAGRRPRAVTLGHAGVRARNCSASTVSVTLTRAREAPLPISGSPVSFFGFSGATPALPRLAALAAAGAGGGAQSRLSSAVAADDRLPRRVGGSASCFLSRISGWRDRRLYPLAGAAEVARRIRCAPWPAPVLSFFVIGSAGV